MAADRIASFMKAPIPNAYFFNLRSEFQVAVLATVNAANIELLTFDPDYSDWAINTPGFEHALRSFLNRNPRARLRMMITDVNRLTRDYPRLVGVLRTHAHVAECRVVPQKYAHLSETMVIADRTSALRRPICTSCKGVLRALDLEYAGAQRERFEELWEACVDQFLPSLWGV
jgi:hypothetical protein